MRPCFIGCDIGTQGTKTAIYAADGALLADSFEASVLLHPEPGAVTQAPEEMLGSVCRTIRAALEKSGIAPGQIAAVGVDAQMAGILGVGGDGIAVTPYDSWLDTRCAPYVSTMKEAAEEAVIRLTGGQVTVNHGPKILWWKGERPEAYARIARFVPPSAYVGMRLCGLTARDAYIDDTHLHFTGFADNPNRRWDEGLLGAFEVAAEKMPAIRRPAERIGTLTKEMAAACGLPAGIPVAAGCGDSAASALGAGVLRPGEMYDVAGTASIFSCVTDRYAPDLRHKTLLFTRSAADGLWNALAYISGGGMCLHWYRKLSALTYKELDEAAAGAAPGCGGLLFLPHFAGRTCPSVPEVRGTWLGLGWEHGTGTLFRSILESVAYEYRLYLDILRESNPALRPDTVTGAGGGSHSAVFNQIKADVLGLPYRPLTGGDTATRGAAILAGCAAGAYASPQDAAAAIRSPGPARLPETAYEALYGERTAAYRRALEGAAVLYRSLKNGEGDAP